MLESKSHFDFHFPLSSPLFFIPLSRKRNRVWDSIQAKFIWKTIYYEQRMPISGETLYTFRKFTYHLIQDGESRLALWILSTAILSIFTQTNVGACLLIPESRVFQKLEGRSTNWSLDFLEITCNNFIKRISIRFFVFISNL